MSSLDSSPLRIELTVLQGLSRHERDTIGKGRQVRIWSNEHRAWWGHKAAGYTAEECKAGVYTFAEAWAHTSHCGPEKAIRFVEALPLSTPGIADEELLRRAVGNARHRQARKGEKHPRWTGVMDAFALGSTYAHALWVAT